MATKKERRNDAAQVIRQRFVEASEAKSNRNAVLWASYKNTDPSYVPSKIPHPRVKSPYLFSVKNTKLSWLLRALYANGRLVSIQPQSPEYADDAAIVDDLVNAQFENRLLKNPEKLESGLDQGFAFGDHYWLWRWYEDGDGNWGVRLINLNINDVFEDPWRQEWIILRRFVTIAELANEARVRSAPVMEKDPQTGEEVPVLDAKGKPVLKDGGTALNSLKTILSAIKEDGFSFDRRWGWYWTQYHETSFPTDTGRYTGSAEDMSGVNAKDDPANVRVTLLEYHERRPDGIVHTIIPDNPKATEPLDLEWVKPTRQPYGRCQIVKWGPYPVYDEAYSYSLYEIVGGLARLHDFSLRASARRVQRFADPAILHRKRAKIPPIYLKSQSNVAIPVEDVMQDMRVLDPPAGGDMHHALHLITKSAMDMGTSESEQRRGSPAGASSATAAAIAEQAGSSNDYLVARRAFRAIVECAELILRILRVHITSEKALSIVGERAATAMRILKPDILKQEYWVRINGSISGQNPAVRRKELADWATRYAQTGLVDLNSVAAFELREIGFEDPDKFLIQKRGPLPLPPAFEHEQLFELGQKIRVSPQDDHQDHMLKHRAELLLRQSGFVGTDPSQLVELARHAAEHAIFLQQQQQAAQASQLAGQGGAQPFQPSQAGQPGQPAVYNARTSDVNAQRQQSNQAAAGSAPGPNTTPGRPVGGFSQGPR